MCILCEKPYQVVLNTAQVDNLCEEHRKFYTCDECGAVSTDVVDLDESRLCLSCRLLRRRCVDCGRYERMEKMECHTYDWICKECYGVNYIACKCGYLTRLDEMYTVNGENICGHCYRDVVSDNCRNIGEPINGKTFSIIKSSRRYGVEIETDCGNYVSVPKQWGIKLDGSIYGLELVSPLMSGDEGLESIRELYEAVDPVFTESCGIHVHVDVRDLNETQLLDLVRAFENTKNSWIRKVPEHRMQNVHCKGENIYPENETWNEWFDSIDGDRYKWVNFKSVEDHGSVELRILEGCGVDKVVNWVAMVVNFVEQVVNMDRTMVTSLCL